MRWILGELSIFNSGGLYGYEMLAFCQFEAVPYHQRAQSARILLFTDEAGVAAFAALRARRMCRAALRAMGKRLRHFGLHKDIRMSGCVGIFASALELLFELNFDLLKAGEVERLWHGAVPFRGSYIYYMPGQAGCKITSCKKACANDTICPNNAAFGTNYAF